MISVPDVMRDIGFEWRPADAWTIGAAVREAYAREYGVLPKKELRPKTSGAGSHCFAIYPESFRERIVEIVEMYGAARDSQPDLFKND